MLTHNLQRLRRLSPQCGDNLDAAACRDGEIVVSPIRQLGRVSRDEFALTLAGNEIVHAASAQCLQSLLSLTPGFSQVSGAGNMEKPFQRFLCVSGKPLKRFTGRAATNTRLKPGANGIVGSSGIHVASYVTKLIPKKRLEQKFHEAVKMARARLAEGGKP